MWKLWQRFSAFWGSSEGSPSTRLSEGTLLRHEKGSTISTFPGAKCSTVWRSCVVAGIMLGPSLFAAGCSSVRSATPYINALPQTAANSFALSLPSGTSLHFRRREDASRAHTLMINESSLSNDGLSITTSTDLVLASPSYLTERDEAESLLLMKIDQLNEQILNQTLPNP